MVAAHSSDLEAAARAGLRTAFREHAQVRLALPGVLQQVDAGQLLPSVAARGLLREMGLVQAADVHSAGATP